MSRSTRHLPYRAHLLRMWVEHSTHHLPIWRFSLEDVESGKRYGFPDLDALISYLLELMNELPEQGKNEPT